MKKTIILALCATVACVAAHAQPAFRMAGMTSCSDNDISLTDEELFENEMTATMADALTYGPPTEACAKEVAARYNGCVTEINYKTRESATQKCITDKYQK